MRFSTKSLFVLATITCGMFANAAPIADTVEDSVAFTHASSARALEPMHVDDFPSILPRGGAEQCQAQKDQCLKAAAKKCKGAKAKCAAQDACEADFQKCMKKYVKPATSAQAGETCGICLEEFVKGQGDLKTLPCNHFFDKACIKAWMATPGAAKTCPMCRQ